MLPVPEPPMKRILIASVPVLIALVGLAAFAWQRENGHRLQQEIARRREAARASDRLTSENQRLRDLLAVPGSAISSQNVQAEIAQPRPTRPPLSARAERPPQFTRIEQFQNSGQATPSAAFQTLVWAVAKADEAALASLLRISPSGQEKLSAVWNNLPPESRTRLKEPVQLLTLLLAMDILNEDGYEIAGEMPQAGGSVLLRVNRIKDGQLQGEKRLPLQQGPAGWQFVIPDDLIEKLPEALAQASLYVAPSGQR